MEMVIHILKHGYPYCKFTTEFPGQWKSPNKWLGFTDTETIEKEKDSLCEKCLDEHIEILKERR